MWSSWDNTWSQGRDVTSRAQLRGLAAERVGIAGFFRRTECNRTLATVYAAFILASVVLFVLAINQPDVDANPTEVGWHGVVLVIGYIVWAGMLWLVWTPNHDDDMLNEAKSQARGWRDKSWSFTKEASRVARGRLRDVGSSAANAARTRAAKSTGSQNMQGISAV